MFASASSSSSSSSSSWVSLDSLVLVDNFSSRRLLLHTPLYKPIAGVPSPIPPSGNIRSDSPGGNSFDSNVVLILVVLLCALVGALGVNSVVRCALRCSNRAESETNEQEATQLAQTGVKKKALKTFPTLAYSVGLNFPGLNSECVICLSEFVQGECLRILPKCNHGFHVKCIDKWLAAHSSCPTCRQCLLNTYQKKVEGSQAGFSDSRQIISPLEPESLLINNWDLC